MDQIVRYNTTLPKLPDDDWQDALEDLRGHFAKADGTGQEKLGICIEQIFNAIPQNRDNSTRLGPTGNYDRALEPFEAIPDTPRQQGEIFRALGKVLAGLPKWNHPNVMHNINPPSMIEAVAASAVVDLFNPNALWDYVSAGALTMERQIVRQMAELANWTAKPDGVFTFGGKGCLSYAVRIGLNRCLPGSAKTGISGCEKPPVVITSAITHYSLNSACSLLGIGTANCLRTTLNDDDTMNMESFETILDRALENGNPIAAIVLSGGDTLNLSIDDVCAANAIIDRLVEKHGLEYRPYVYFDLVVGWPWLYFADYDFATNPGQLPFETIERIEKAVDAVRQVEFADGFGVDFHKLGHCPYATSLFMTKAASELHSINMAEQKELDIHPDGGNFVLHHTIEHSRRAGPILAAWVALQLTGKSGMQAYLVNGVATANVLGRELAGHGFELVNPFGLGFALVVSPRSPDIEKTYDELFESDRETIERHNKYTFDLFHYLSDGKANGVSSFIFRFVPQYRRARCGLDIAVIVVYPMSLETGPDLARQLAGQTGRIKHDFDAVLLSTHEHGAAMPLHVPK